MIRINLLPADLRRGNRLPPRVLAAAFGAALLISAAVGWFALVYFGTLAAAEQQLVKVTAELDSRQAKVTYHDKLLANQKDYALRVQTIQDIGNSRRVWSQFMDDLIDVVNNNGATERHLAWFDGITVKGDPKKGVKVTLPSNVQGEDKSLMANFHEDLEAAPFAADLSRKSDPTFKLEEDEIRIPAAFLRFPMELEFKPITPAAKKKK
jgi:Tfp pilus assembly protein PilN